MVAKCTGIIPIIPDLVSASGMKIGAVYKRVYGFTDLRGRPAGRGRARRGPPNQVTAGKEGATPCTVSVCVCVSSWFRIKNTHSLTHSVH